MRGTQFDIRVAVAEGTAEKESAIAGAGQQRQLRVDDYRVACVEMIAAVFEADNFGASTTFASQ